MLLAIIQSYLTLLVSIGLASLGILIIGLYFIFRKPTPKQTIVDDDFDEEVETVLISEPVPMAEGYDDLIAISGEDVMTTQLDLARAYIETGKNEAAQDILHYVIEQGNETQQAEAQQLMIQL